MTRRSVLIMLSVIMILAWGNHSLADRLELPQDLTTIADEAFYGDESLTEVVLPEGLEVIGSKAFRDCPLTSVILPDSLRVIADDAFNEPGTIEIIANRGSLAYQWAKENHYIADDIVTYETVTVDIPFETEYIDAPNWPVGEEAVVTEGRNGQKEITYAVTKDPNGNEISRAVSSERIIQTPVNKVVYKGTFVPVITYEYVQVPDLPECDPSLRDSGIDAECAEWAMVMAKSNTVKHAPMGCCHCESVGAWGSIDEILYGREYTVVIPQPGQVVTFENVSLGSHGGSGLCDGYRWGAGCVIRHETQPDGSVVSVFFACARSELD